MLSGIHPRVHHQGHPLSYVTTYHSVFIISGDYEFSPYHLSWCVFLRILFSEVCSFLWSWEQYFPRSFMMAWMTGPLVPSYLPARKFMTHNFSPWAVQIHCFTFFSGTEYVSPKSLIEFWFLFRYMSYTILF